MVSWQQITFISFGLTVSLLFLLLACTLENNWYPMIILIPLFMIPIPFIFLKNGNLEDPGHGNLDGIAYIHLPSFMLFFLGGILVCPIAIPSVMVHVGTINLDAGLYTIASAIVLYACSIGYSYITASSSSGSGLGF